MDLISKVLQSHSLDPSELESLASNVILRAYKKGQILNTNKSVMQIISGVVRLSKVTEEGNEIFVGFCRKGDILGKLFTSDSMDHSKVISDRAEVLQLKASAIVGQSTKLLTLSTYATRLEQQLTFTENFYLSLIGQDIKTRLVYFLEYLIKKSGSYNTKGEIVIDYALTIEEIARSIAATRQSVSFYINKFQKDGWIKKNRKKFIFTTAFYQDQLIETSLV